MENSLEKITHGILDGDQSLVVTQVQAALADKVEPQSILDAMTRAMTEVGRLFEEGEYFVPEMLVSARAMQAGMNILQPALTSGNIKSKGKVIIGTVKGDLHDIGKNLVGIMLKGAGYEVDDLGTDVPPEVFVEKIKDGGVNVLALSALLTTTMTGMKMVVDAINSAGLRNNLKIIIGGAPITDTYATQIGADGYAEDASKAVRLVENLLEGS
jgi:5-methyltetrahydrofolate--homocysteine methyltransferase